MKKRIRFESRMEVDLDVWDVPLDAGEERAVQGQEGSAPAVLVVMKPNKN